MKHLSQDMPRSGIAEFYSLNDYIRGAVESYNRGKQRRPFRLDFEHTIRQCIFCVEASNGFYTYLGNVEREVTKDELKEKLMFLLKNLDRKKKYYIPYKLMFKFFRYIIMQQRDIARSKKKSKYKRILISWGTLMMFNKICKTVKETNDGNQ